MAPRRPLGPGDRVRYSSEFCRQLGAATGWLPSTRGTITALWGQGSQFARILWDYPGPNGSRDGGAHLSALETAGPKN